MNSKERRAINREIATVFVNKVNAETFCKYCGGQPIEWHLESHPKQPNARVSSLRSQGCSIKRIQEEMDKCEPVCRTCHMSIDGRHVSLRQAAPYQKGETYVPQQPCKCCKKLAKPLRKKMCTGCYNHHSGLRPRKKKNGCDCDM